MKLDSWIIECETKLSGSCSSLELKCLGDEVLAKKTLLMSFARKSAEMIINSKGNMLLEEEATLRKELAGYQLRYSNLQEDLAVRCAQRVCPTDYSCWLTNTELQLK